jgi:hypothetical protein
MKAHIIAILICSIFLFSNCSGLFEEEQSYDDCSGKVIDSRGTYTKIRIGDQCWIKEDLTVDYDSRGQIVSTRFEGNVYYTNDYAISKNVSLCPAGFKLPNTEEWNKLGLNISKLEITVNGFLVKYFRSYIFKSSIATESRTYTRNKDKKMYWIVEGDWRVVFTLSVDSERGMVEPLPPLLNEVGYYPGTGITEYPYFGIKCIRMN